MENESSKSKMHIKVNNSTWLMIGIAIIIGLFIIIFLLNPNNKLEGYVTRVGYIEIENPSGFYFIGGDRPPIKRNAYVLNTYEEFIEFRDKYRFDGDIKDYTDDYFIDNVLIVDYIQTSSGSIKYYFNHIEVTEESINIYIDSNNPSVGTCDMSGYLVVAEIPKELYHYGMDISIK